MALQDTDTDMYADDSTLTAQAKTTPELEEKLSSDAAKVSTWCQENHMATKHHQNQSHVGYNMAKASLTTRK